MRSGWFRLVPDGLEITVRLTPKSSRDALEGAESGADGGAWLKARVRAVPEDGKANKALIAVHGNEIFKAAHEKGVIVAFEAAVAGGIPVIKSLREVSEIFL